MDVVHPRCCGMDISKRDAKVCVRIQDGSRVRTKVTTWSSLSSQIVKLAEHLQQQRVTLVTMEATGDYWKPFYFLLTESGLEVMLVNARDRSGGMSGQVAERVGDVGGAGQAQDVDGEVRRAAMTAGPWPVRIWEPGCLSSRSSTRC